MNRLSLLLPLSLLPLAASAQSYSESFDANHTANWSFNSALGSSDGAADSTGNEANFFFDYSSVGIPSAPHSTGGTTTGLKLGANVAGNVFTGLSVSPIGQSFSGDYTLQFDAWQNFVASGDGSTQLTMGGIGSAATTAQFPGGTYNGLGFAATGDGGSTTDYRGYNGSGTQIAVGSFAAASQNNTAAYYTSRYNGAYPAAQTAKFPTQTGTVQSGALGMAWHTWTIAKVGTTVTWSVDGSLLATATNATFSGTDLFLGMFDSNTASSGDANNLALNFALFDNVIVTPRATPEPASLAALGLGAIALVRRRKRS